MSERKTAETLNGMSERNAVKDFNILSEGEAAKDFNAMSEREAVKDLNRKLRKVFDTPNGKAFIPFLTAGDPSADATVRYILEMEKAGADLIEIGIPFSDPIAEGPVIQEADIRALKGGMTTDGAFDIVKRVREKSGIPLAFMTYANPVFHYGYDNFFTKCEEAGVDAIIIPDLPFEEKREVEATANAHNVALISMIAPTSESRIQEIASEAKGFIYVVSSMGVTGTRSEIRTDVGAIVESIRRVTDVPCAIGFGISNPEQAKAMAAVSDGAIVGSAIVKIIARYAAKLPSEENGAKNTGTRQAESTENMETRQEESAKSMETRQAESAKNTETGQAESAKNTESRQAEGTEAIYEASAAEIYRFVKEMKEAVLGA